MNSMNYYWGKNLNIYDEIILSFEKKCSIFVVGLRRVLHQQPVDGLLQNIPVLFRIKVVIIINTIQVKSLFEVFI